MYLLTYVPNENTNQPEKPRSLIRAFVVRMKQILHPWLSNATDVDSDQTARMRILFWISSGTRPKVRFLHCGSNGL